jgi:hypothetical protein
MSDWAIITGATSGLGAAYARLLGRRGFNLLLTGRRRELLESVARGIADESGVRAESLTCELSDDADVKVLLQRIDQLENPRWLINNAGFALGASLAESDPLDMLSMIRVQAEVPVMLMHQVLPGMIERGEGAIINVSSLACVLAVPKASTYVGTKAFLMRLTESVALEVEGTGVSVQVVLPGFFHSDFHRGTELSQKDKKSAGLIRWMNAPDVAESSLRAIERRGGNVVHIPGFAGRVAAFLARHLPRRVLYAGIKRYSAGRG